MDMSYFRRRRTTGADPAFKILLTEIAARQAATPTALIVAHPDADASDCDLPPQMQRFVAAPAAQRAKGPACGSFHGEVAQALLAKEITNAKPL